MSYNKRNLFQERLAKEDIRLILNALENYDNETYNVSSTRLQLLIGKLKRMEKQ